MSNSVAYKVVAISNGQMFSSWQSSRPSNGFGIEYKLGEWNKPDPAAPNQFLCVFATRQAARNYVNDTLKLLVSETRIFKCYVKNPLPFRSAAFDNKTNSWPPQTLFVDEVYLLPDTSKWTKAYKVLYRNQEGKLLSALLGGERHTLSKEYFPDGQITVPHAGTQLFAFGDLKEAQEYASFRDKRRSYHTQGEFEIWEVRAKGFHLNGWFENTFSLDVIKKAFADKTKSFVLRKSDDYETAACCDAIQLLKKV